MSLENGSKTPDHESSPYQGFQPFAEKDSHYFFGRERDIKIIASNLCVAKLTILYGASGVGKSSVLMAGVLPQLKQEQHFVIVLFRDWQRPDFESAIREAFLKNETLIKKSRESGQPINPDPSLPFDELLAEYTKALHISFLFIFDQFEEYLVSQQSPSYFDESFDAQLARAINRREIHANFLLSVREDSLSKLDRFHVRVPNLLNNILPLEHLDRASAEQAIREPLNVYNKRNPHTTPITIDDNLVEDVLDQIKIGRINLVDEAQEKIIPESYKGASGERMSEEIEAPYLQMVLSSLWDEETHKGSRKLRHETLKKLGGAEKIVRKQFDDAMDSLEEEESELAAQLFYYLVSPTGQKFSYTVTDLAIWTGKPEQRVEKVLSRLSSSDLRILRPVAPPPGQIGNERYEIFHDALAPAIAAWVSRQSVERERKRKDYELRKAEKEKELQLKQAKEEQEYKLQKAKEEQEYKLRKAREEQELQLRKAKEEQEKAEQDKRRFRNVAAIFIVLFGLIVILYIYAFIQKGIAQKAQDETLKEKSNAELALAEVKRLDSALPHSSFVLRGHSGAIYDIEFNSDGNYVVTASEDGTSRVWDVASGASRAILRGHSDAVISASFSPNSARVITASKDKTAKVWDVNTEKSLATLDKHVDIVTSAVFSPDGEIIATGSGDNTAWLWNANTYEPMAELRGHTGPVINLAFSPDSKYLLTASEDLKARIWDVKTGESLHELRGHTGAINGAVFSPDGRFAATASADKTARVWNASNGEPVVVLRGHTGRVNSIVFSSDSKSVVTSGDDGAAQIWDALKGKSRFKLIGHTDRVINAVYAEDGKRITTASQDKTARVWDARTGQLLFTLQGGHTEYILAAACSTDGRLLATASGDTTARIWSVSDEPVPGGFRVTEAVLKADPEHSGQCPATIKFKGQITVVGSGKVSYRFIRSNGAIGQIQTLTFDQSGSKEVSTTWTLGSPSYSDLSEWQAIQILEPREMESGKAKFTVQCESNADLPVPKQVSPSNGQELPSNPKEAVLSLEPVQDAASHGINSYRIEVQYYDQKNKKWQSFGNFVPEDGNSRAVTFKTPQVGRWRVYAVDEQNRRGKKSGWWEFRFK